jgi:GNAT superfamily N-acetyltransferase
VSETNGNGDKLSRLQEKVIQAGGRHCDAVTGPLEIRPPRPDDVPGIVEVVRNCQPFLSSHPSYLYWMVIQYFAGSCAVAQLDGKLVGWCSMIRVSSEKYFLHQLAVAPRARRHGIAAALFTGLVQTLKRQHRGFELEFTSDRRNNAVLDFNKSMAERVEMRLVKKPDRVQVIEEGEEDLYALTSTEKGRPCTEMEVTTL